MSPPSRWSGLKYTAYFQSIFSLHVSTLAVEWIEIIIHLWAVSGMWVSTLAVEWIEMTKRITD